MRSIGVVVDPPSFDDESGLAKRGELVLVQAFVTKTAVERFDVGILCWFAGLDEVQANPAIARPASHGDTREFGAVIHHDGLRKASHRADRIEDTRNTMSRERRVDLNRKAFSREIVDDVERSDTAAAF